MHEEGRAVLVTRALAVQRTETNGLHPDSPTTPPHVQLPTALLRFSRSRGEWVEVAAATQPRLYKDAASKWHLEVAGAQVGSCI